MSNRLKNVFGALIYLLIFQGCSDAIKTERAIDPWVVRVNLDGRPNMIGLALNNEMYAAYDGKMGALYKVWKGGFKFTGPVFDNIHGPQPLSQGESYIHEELSTSPWSVTSNDKKQPSKVSYKGYIFENDQITLKYTIALNSGELIHISETPEYIVKDGKPGFSRVFNSSDVPVGYNILLTTSFKHLMDKNELYTDGEWMDTSFSNQTFDWGASVKGKGTLKLKSNGTTTLKSFFQPKATAHIKPQETEEENTGDSTTAEESKVDAVDSDNLAVLSELGRVVIGKNDCAACHLPNKQAIGPSYIMIAQKYQSNLETINQLSQKIISGGTGEWGERAMSPHPDLSEIDAKAMAAYILTLAPDGEADRKPGVVANFYQTGQPLSSLPEVVAGQNPNASDVYHSVAFASGNPDLGEDTDENFSGLLKDFVMDVKGFLNVPKTQTYQMKFIANNGGKLTINGEKVSEGSFYEGTYEEEFEVTLKKGANPFEIEFYHHLFDKYLVLQWKENGKGEYKTIPASVFTHNIFDIKTTSPGIKTLVSNKSPGFGASLEKVHPSFDLSTVRPEGFEPRVGDIEFRKNGNLVLCTWDGQVYEIENPTNSNTSEIKVTKIADGLCEPLGITEVDGDVYVLQRWELTKLIDNDGDRITDEYISIATFGSNASFHEWSFGLVYKDGYFYCTTGIAMGDNKPIDKDRGKALKIGMDGSYSYVAHGLKEPNGIGIGPDGEIFVADNEGEYQPVCKIFHIPAEGNPFYGNKSVEADSLPKNIKDVPPVIWLPQNEIGNSPSQPILVQHSGPYNGQMFHGEITHGGIKRDFIEKIKGQYQGAVFRFTQGLEVGINRLEWGPDGSLYAAGLGGRQDFGHQGHTFGLQRLTYNGRLPFEMLAIRAKFNGLEVEFTKPLRIGDGTKPSDYKIQQWYYTWTHEGESTQKRDLENLPVKSVTLSEDRKKVFLELPEMKEEHVLYVQLQPTFLSSDNEQLWSNEGWYTMNRIPNEKGDISPYPYPKAANKLTPPEQKDGWTLLFDGKSTNSWKTLGSASWKVDNGHIHANGGSSLFVSDLSYDNFVLEVEWKLDSGAEGGILYNVPNTTDIDKISSVSPRMQLTDDSTEDAKNVHTHKSGANYDIMSPKYVTTNPVNEYNLARLIVNGNQVEHWINGVIVTEYELGGNKWKEDLKISRYANNADYGKADEGKIALFSKNGNIWIRNVRVKKL
jgi:cytochrome c